jgi:hypothetical protein
MVNKKQMKSVSQFDPSDGAAAVHSLPDTKQKIPTNEEEGENNPSTTLSPGRACVSEGKGADEVTHLNDADMKLSSKEPGSIGQHHDEYAKLVERLINRGAVVEGEGFVNKTNDDGPAKNLNEGDEAVLVEDAAVGDDDNVPMMTSIADTVDGKLDVLQVVGIYVQELIGEASVPDEKPVCSLALSDLTAADVKALAGGMLYFHRHEVNAEVAVEKFLECYPCMRELSGTNPHFSGMNVSLLKFKLKP